MAMIEVSRQFPTPDAMDKIAGALNIKTWQLFAVPPGPEDAAERLYHAVAKNIEEAVGKAVEKAVEKAMREALSPPNCPALP